MRGTLLFYVLLTVYILAVNFYAFRLVKSEADTGEEGDSLRREDVRLLLAAILGGAAAVFVTMLVLRFRLGNALLMIALPLITVLNGYCFYLGYRGITGLI